MAGWRNFLWSPPIDLYMPTDAGFQVPSGDMGDPRDKKPC